MAGESLRRTRSSANKSRAPAADVESENHCPTEDDGSIILLLAFPVLSK